MHACKAKLPRMARCRISVLSDLFGVGIETHLKSVVEAVHAHSFALVALEAAEVTFPGVNHRLPLRAATARTG